MKKILPIIFFLSLSVFANSQNDEVVKNVNWEFSGIKMIISYDLISLDGNKRTYEIDLKINVNGEKIIADQGLAGIGRQPTGKGKQIVWFFTRNGKSEEELNVDGLQVTISASNPIPDVVISEPEPEPVKPEPKEEIKQPISPPTIINTNEKPSLVLPLAVTAVGTSGVVIALLQEGKAKNLYDNNYKLNFDPSNAALSQEAYDEANDKHLSAQYIGIGSGVLLGTGAYLLFRTLKKRSSGNFSVVPALEDAPLYGSYGGVGVTYRF